MLRRLHGDRGPKWHRSTTGVRDPKAGNLPFFPSALLLFVACEPMDANAAAVPHTAKRWQPSGTDDPERLRSLQSRFSAWTPLSDQRRNLQVSKRRGRSGLSF